MSYMFTNKSMKFEECEILAKELSTHIPSDMSAINGCAILIMNLSAILNGLQEINRPDEMQAITKSMMEIASYYELVAIGMMKKSRSN